MTFKGNSNSACNNMTQNTGMYCASLSTAASLETFDEKLLGGVAESARAPHIKRVRGEESSGGAYIGVTHRTLFTPT